MLPGNFLGKSGGWVHLLEAASALASRTSRSAARSPFGNWRACRRSATTADFGSPRSRAADAVSISRRSARSELAGSGDDFGEAAGEGVLGADGAVGALARGSSS